MKILYNNRVRIASQYQIKFYITAYGLILLMAAAAFGFNEKEIIRARSYINKNWIFFFLNLLKYTLALRNLLMKSGGIETKTVNNEEFEFQFVSYKKLPLTLKKTD